MTLEQFCKKAGCVVSLREDWEGYAGKWMYHSVDSPNVRYCGYKSEAAAYKAFLDGAYGKIGAKAVLMLLRKVKEVDDLRRSQREAWHYSYQLEQERKQLQAMLDHERTENEVLLRQALDALAASDDFLFNYHECEPNNELELDAYGELRGNNYAAIERLMERLK